MSYLPVIPQTTVQTSEPSAEPVTLSEAKAHCRVTTDADDALLSAYLITARLHVEGIIERALARRTFRTRMARFPYDSALIVPCCPLVSVTTLKYYDVNNTQQTWDAANYVVLTDATPGMIELANNVAWPDTTVRSDAVEIVYTAGYAVGSIDQRARHAIRLLVGHWYENRESTTVGVEVKEIPQAVESLLWQLRTGVVR